MSEPIKSPVGFSDSELSGYTREGDTLVVRVKGWNAKRINLKFVDIIGQRDVGAGSFSAAVQGAEVSAGFLREVLAQSFTVVPQTHSYLVYSFLDHDDRPTLEIVAASCEVTVEA
ncbi:MAG: hypothetical protein ACOY0T_37670 [Myxococcota bacterium]